MNARPSVTVAAVIERAVWLDADAIRATRERHRSPLVLLCVEDYLAGRRYPLTALIEHA